MTVGTRARTLALAGGLVLALGAGFAAGAGASGRGGAEHDPGGLQVSSEGYTLVPTRTVLERGDDVPFTFRVTGPDGRPVAAYEVAHEKRLHLVVVRRDTADYQHVHPTMADDGTWRVPLDLREAGTYRVFADFVASGYDKPLTLGTDVFVPGRFVAQPLPAPSSGAKVGDYTVHLAGTPVAGQSSPLAVHVMRDGKPVEDLEPYLGAYGHLVALRAGDLGYLHVHPAQHAVGEARGGPEVRFTATFPSAGAYRLFLDFQHDGVVRTAVFTVVAESGPSEQGSEGGTGAGHHH